MLNISLEALENFISQMGATVENQASTFNPYQAGYTSTTGVSTFVDPPSIIQKKSDFEESKQAAQAHFEPEPEEIVCPERNIKIFSKLEHCSHMSNIAFMQLIENVEGKLEDKTCTLVKVSFEDGHVLQGVFSA